MQACVHACVCRGGGGWVGGCARALSLSLSLSLSDIIKTERHPEMILSQSRYHRNIVQKGVKGL